MTTDNKTLADAQPGGRVRLGDALLPCPLCGNDAEFVPYKNNGLTLKCKSMGCIQRHQRTLRYGIEWLRTSMTEHWNTRALSAQPSPGGQGDALQILANYLCVPVCDLDMEDTMSLQGAVEAIDLALDPRQPVRIYGCCAQPEGELHTAECPNMRHLAARQPVGEPVEMSPEFTDTARAAIAWVLWHHQGGSSPVGQPLRFALGMGQHDRMTDHQIAEAKRFAAWAGATTEGFHRRDPAQAVDLGALQGVAAEYQKWIEFHSAGNGDYDDFLRMHVFSDSQAVGK
jgi:hypothetical protein